MARMEDLHADVRLKRDYDGVRGEGLEELHNEEVVLELRSVVFVTTS
jgi:hypothetical protein